MNKVSVAFDAKRAVANFTGLGNYSRYVVDVLSRFYPQLDYLLYAPAVRQNKELDRIILNRPVTLHYPESSLWKRFSALWRISAICSELKLGPAKLYHGLSNELPLGIRNTGIKSVVTIHDLIFLRYPHCYKPIDRFIYNLKFKYACHKSDRIIAVSECTKQDIVNFYGISPDKIDVVYQGCDPRFAEQVSSEELERVKQKYALPDRFLLNVGSIEERKNLLLVVKALELIDPAIHLVAVGRKTAYTEQVSEYAEKKGLSGRVHLVHGLSHADLPAVYQQADMFVYPSRFEGFGIPVIEALHSGLPVIAATGSCLEEAGGASSVYVDPDDDEAMGNAINKILSDRVVYERMVKNGREYVSRFDDKLLAGDLMACYLKTGAFTEADINFSIL